MTRLHLMEPTTSENLDRFLADFALTGSYYIAVAGGVTSEATGASFVPLRNGVIFKRTLLVREAWQIGPNDPDMIGISRSDDVQSPKSTRPTHQYFSCSRGAPMRLSRRTIESSFFTCL